MTGPEGFAFTATKDGRVRIAHHGRVVTTLGGEAARRFLARAERADADRLQHLLARATGHYKHGNER